MVKSILKRYSRTVNSRPENNPYTPQEEVDSPKKRVSFDGPELVKVFEADEWDRSPAQITLKLTYKDVAELREMNISLIKPGPLAMERTKSRRPIPRSAAPQLSSLNSSGQPARNTPQPNTSPFHYTPVARPSSPIPGLPTLSLSSQIPPALSTRSLPVLMEDQPSSPTAVASTTADDSTNSESEGDSLSFMRSPPGLSVRNPVLNSLPSSIPTSLSTPTSHSASPKPPPVVASATPLYRPPHLRAKSANSLVKSQDVSHVTHELEKLVIDPEAHGNPILSSCLKASELISLEGKAQSVSLVLNKDGDKNSMSAATSPMPPPLLSRRPSRSLMGWELKRSANAQGKLGFGLVRKQQVNNDVLQK